MSMMTSKDLHPIGPQVGRKAWQTPCHKRAHNRIPQCNSLPEKTQKKKSTNSMPIERVESFTLMWNAGRRRTAG